MSYLIEELRKRNTMTAKQKQEITCSEKNSTGLKALQKMSNNLMEKSKEDFEQQLNTIGSKIIKETSKVYHEQKIEVLFLIDKSGSCRGTEMATCKSYNHLIAQEKKEKFPTIVTNVLFAGEQQEVAFRKNIGQVDPLKYCANGDSTAIYDTICTYINKIMNAQLNDENKPKKTIVAIMTDGLDNASVHFTESDTYKLVEMAKKRGWEFIFLGAMENAYQVGVSLGMHPDYIAQIDMSDEGMVANFQAIEEAIQSVRKSGKIDSSWKRGIQDLSLEDKDQAKRLRLDVK